MNYSASLAFTFAILLQGSAYSADIIEKRFHQFDTNHDGILSGDELLASPILQKLAAAKQGPLTLEEARRILSRLKATGAPLEVPAPKATQENEAPLTEAPLIISPSNAGLGRQVGDFTLQSSKGEPVKLSELAKGNAVVLALFNNKCPISNKLAPELSRIEKAYALRSVKLCLVHTSTEPNLDDTRKFLEDSGIHSPWFLDQKQSLQQSLLATTSTEVFVLDRSRTLVYRGAINDQYGLGYSKDSASKHFLREALDSLLSDKPIEVRATTSPGCSLDLVTNTSGPKTELTYHKDIARIIQSHCIECHHGTGLAPFSLEKYEDVIENAGMIKKQVDRGVMPPWFAANHPGHSWSNDRSMSDQDKNDLIAWLGSARPIGNVEDAPLPRHFSGEWTIGTPDTILEMPKSITIKAEGTMPYQHSVIETSFPEDRWVQAYEIIPQARGVVHHVIVSMHEKGTQIGGGNAAGGFWAAYVPGNSYRNMPEGFAKRLPAGARLRLQIHYTPNGKAVEDKIRIGLKFTKKDPLYEVKVSSLWNPRIHIPPGASDHVEYALRQVNESMSITGYMAHMHVRGKAFKYELITPGQPPEVLLDIPRYDFNWQLQYTCAQPKVIPPGSTLKITAVFDNSKRNPANPDPTKAVRWGEQTNDEMMIGYFEHFAPITRR